MGTPSGQQLNERSGELDGGDAVLFASGTGASTSVVLALLQPGDTIAVAEGSYFGTSTCCSRNWSGGVCKYVEFDQTEPPPDGVQLVWLEAPSNPFLTMPDFEAAASYPAPVLVDATAATPVHVRPLEHGADLVLHSATKYLGGHSDVLLGAVVCGDPETARRLREFRTRTGIVAAPDPAWLLLRGLKTLELRVHRQTETAQRSRAGWKRTQPSRRSAIAGFGGLMSFDVTGDPRRVETATRLIANATSLGGVESTMESRHRWEGDRVPKNLLRLSVGLEDVEELWADLEQALSD